MKSSITIRIPQATVKGYIECPLWGVFDWAYPDSKLRRGRVQEGGGGISNYNVQPQFFIRVSSL